MQSNNGGVEVVQCFNAPYREMKCTVNVFPPSCLSWNIFNPNKPVFTLDAARGCHSFPDTLLKVRLNSPLINKLICKVFPEVYHSFDGNVTWPVLYGGVSKTQIFTAITWMKAREGEGVVSTFTHTYFI